MPVRKRFGQHFLHDPGVIAPNRRCRFPPSRRSASSRSAPDGGALTWGLLEPASASTSSRSDRDLAQTPESRSAGEERIAGARRECPRQRISSPCAAAAPRCASSAIFLQHFHSLVSPAGPARSHIRTMYFMLQKRCRPHGGGSPGTREYGFGVIRSCSRRRPRSKASSTSGPRCVPGRAPRSGPPSCACSRRRAPRFDIGREGALRTVVTAAFSHRRKPCATP